MGRPPYHHHYRPSRPRGGNMALLVLLCAAALAGGAAVVVTLAAVLVAMVMAVGPPVLAGAAVVAIVSSRRRHRQAGWRPELYPRPVHRPPPEPDWHTARARFVQLRSEYGQFECDPLAVLRLPALTDVTVASTGRFVDAFAEAQALDTDSEPSPAHRVRYVAAVDQACRAWRAAQDAAERIRLAGIPEHERATVQRAIKLLTMARDSDHDAERSAAYAKARAELAKLDRTGSLRLPPAAAAALDAAARSQLPPAPAAS
ncbi:MAG TPA: hypothetical protein VIY28_19250 [Pseudonocardiaceae bacterium]